MHITESDSNVQSHTWLDLSIVGLIDQQGIILEVYFILYAYGQNYLFQMAIGQASAFVYLTLALTFDAELQRYCEKTGFILKASRSRKFYLFFFCLVCLTGMIMFYYSL